MLTAAVPVFVTERLWVEVLPTETLPKIMLVEFGERMPAPDDCGLPSAALPTKPAQLDRPMTARIATRGATKAKGPRRIDRFAPFPAMGA
jgi:hypothetical protein